MEKLLNILEGIQPDVDYTKCEDLIDGHMLDSLDIRALVSEIEEAFDIMVPTVEVVPENFNSASRIWAMIQRLEEKG